MKSTFLPQALFLSLIACLLTAGATAQVTINKYAAVLSLDSCNNKLTVDDASEFGTGDTVLMIQMKGAVIDTSNTSAFGTIIDYRGAGNYEYNVIKSKSGNDLILKYVIIRDYNVPDGKVQLVRVPYFWHYDLNQPHTCQPWNGSKGGVFAIRVRDTLKLNSDIDVSGKGFRGAQVLQSTLFGCNKTGYYYPSSNNDGGRKGEGIAEIPEAKMYGRGPLANGGGGGNDHNAGGGGGGNGGNGGLGGNQYNLGSCATTPDIGGIGGRALSYIVVTNKVFLGGGGGAGHGNDMGAKPGAAGGGILLVDAGYVYTASGGGLIANGADAIECSAAAPGCQDDGTGGGGGGGCLFLKASGASGMFNMRAIGGKGANTWVSLANNTTQVAPGGGGGGGVLVCGQTPVFPGLINLLGGNHGVLPQFSNSAWGSTSGQAGPVNTIFNLDFPTDTFANTAIAPDFDYIRTSCFTFDFTDQSTTAIGSLVSWSWDFSDPPGSTLQNPTHTFPGYGDYNVRLVTGNGTCTADIIKTVSIPYVPFADAGADQSTCPGKPVVLTASGGTAYTWSPATGLSAPHSASTTATILQTTRYTVTVTNNEGCTDEDSVTVQIDSGPEITAGSDGGNLSCDNRQLQLHASGGIAYVWHPGIYCNDSTIADPIVSPDQTTVFTVTGTDINGCAGMDSITVFRELGDARIFMPNAFSPNKDNINEVVYPFIICGFELEQFAIYNRWGQRLFSTRELNHGWDGTYKGKPADTGTYYYFISGKKEGKVPVTFKGDLTLIR